MFITSFLRKVTTFTNLRKRHVRTRDGYTCAWRTNFYYAPNANSRGSVSGKLVLFNCSSLLSHSAGWIRKRCFQRTDSLGEQEPSKKNILVSIAVQARQTSTCSCRFSCKHIEKGGEKIVRKVSRYY